MKYLVPFILSICFWANINAQINIDSLIEPRGGIYDTSVIQVSFLESKYTVKYTTDGSIPGSGSATYNTPISLTKPTVIRASFYEAGKKVGTVTQSYIIGRGFDMAVISIAIQQSDFDSPERGLYVKGCCANPDPPYRGANFWKGWEKDINIEMYEPDNTQAFNQEAGMRIFGGFSKGLPMKSLAIIARTEYGDNRFRYPIFPEKDIKKFKSFILRNSGGDFNNTHIRDAVLTRLAVPLDLELQAYRPAVVYINGVYWGIHNIREKLNEHYLKYNCGANKDSVDIMKHRNDLQEGNRREYTKMINYIKKTNFQENKHIDSLDKLMDIDNYINYNQVEVYSDNGDAGGNIRYWREQKPDARWRWMLFDLDLGMGISSRTAYKTNTLQEMTTYSNEKWPNPAWSTMIIRKLLENDSIQEIYINRFADHLNTIFSSQNAVYTVDSLQRGIANEMPFHIQKWPTTIEKWNQRVERIRVFADKRPKYIRTHLMQKFGLTDTVFVKIDSVNKKMGKVKLNSIKIKDSFEGWYFNGNEITIKADPKRGFGFVKWKETGDTNAILTFNPTDSITLTPIFERLPPSELSKTIVFNELSIKQDDDAPSGDWLELYNAGKDSISLLNWKLVTKDKEKFKFKVNYTIAPNEYLIIAKNIDRFKSVYDDTSIVIYPDSIGFGFSSKKDKLYLYDSERSIIDSLHYKTKDVFPGFKDAGYPSIEKKNPQFKSLIEEYRLSEENTPGRQNAGYEAIDNPSNGENGFGLFWVLVGLGSLVGIGGIYLIIFNIRKKKSVSEMTTSL